jgi:hypothetical protein
MKVYYLAIGLILISAISCSFMQLQTQVINKKYKNICIDFYKRKKS